MRRRRRGDLHTVRWRPVIALFVCVWGSLSLSFPSLLSFSFSFFLVASHTYNHQHWLWLRFNDWPPLLHQQQPYRFPRPICFNHRCCYCCCCCCQFKLTNGDCLSSLHTHGWRWWEMGMDKKKREPFFLVVALEKSQWDSNQLRLAERRRRENDIEANNVHGAPTNDFKLVWHKSSMRGCLLNIGMTWACQLLLSIRRCCWCCLYCHQRPIDPSLLPCYRFYSYAHFLCHNLLRSL